MFSSIHLKDTGDSNADRKVAMNRVNPRYVLRNYMLLSVFDAATNAGKAESISLRR